MNWYKKAMAIPPNLSPEEQEWIAKKYLYEHDIYTFRIIKEVVKKLNDYFDFGMSVPLYAIPKKRPSSGIGLGPLSPALWNNRRNKNVKEQPYIHVAPRRKYPMDSDKGKWYDAPISKQDMIRLLAHEASHSWTLSETGDPMQLSTEFLAPVISKLWEETVRELNLKETSGIYELV